MSTHKFQCPMEIVTLDNGNFWKAAMCRVLDAPFKKKPGQVTNMHSFNKVWTMCTIQHLIHFKPLKHTVKLQTWHLTCQRYKLEMRQ